MTRSTRGVAVREGFMEEAAFELRLAGSLGICQDEKEIAGLGNILRLEIIFAMASSQFLLSTSFFSLPRKLSHVAIAKGCTPS